MSWYLFRDAPTLKQRGIKVSNFQQHPLHRPTISLSWGMNEPTRKPPTPNILPATISNTEQEEKIANIPQGKTKVLTETSEEGQEELTRMIKRRDQLRKDAVQKQQANKSQRAHSLHQQLQSPQSPKDNNDFEKQMRYLQSSLLPAYRRDSMGSIFDHRPSKQPLSQSRLSTKSNRKNESSVVLGDGFNVFVPSPQPQKDLTKRLQEMYEYDEECRRRAARGSFLLN